MSQMPSKTKIPVAVPNKTRKFYTQDHITTHSFMMPRPIFCREYLPNRNMQVKVDSFIRCNPMPVPIFGHAKVHNRAFFVPFRAVMHDFNEFYTNTPYNYADVSQGTVITQIPSSVYYIQNSVFVDYFLNTLDQTNGLLISGNSSDYDIVIADNISNPSRTVYAKFTVEGIRQFTILESLGYKINWLTDDTCPLSAMPLFCYAKVMLDWYYPSAYVGDSNYNLIDGYFRLASPYKSVDRGRIGMLLSICSSITYNPDYFVNAWDYPTGPNNISTGLTDRNISILDITNNAATIQGVTNDSNSSTVIYPNSAKPNNGTPFIGSNGQNAYVTSGVTTQYVLDALKSLTDYTKRHQLSGVRALDRYLSELGINLSAEIMNRSMYLGSKEFDMEFYDVFSHADTEAQSGSPLGAYAGKGNGYGGDMIFDFDNGQEFGMFIIVNSIVPVVGYYQGSHRETLHVNAMDFYHADFDHMAVQPISTREVFVTNKGVVAVSGAGVDGGNGLNSTIFGYAPKYIEYNTPQDLQTGLYRIATRNKLLPCYSLMRDLSYYETGPLSQMKHNIGFVKGNDSDQYNRIFYLTKGSETEDQMNAIHHFEVSQTDSTLPAYDTYEFKHEGDQYEGKKVTLDINGSKLN